MRVEDRRERPRREDPDMRAVDIEAFAITGHEDGACFSREREEVVVMWIATH